MSQLDVPTYDLSLLAGSLAKWQRSTGLRSLYGSLYQHMGQHMLPGPSLEIGSGIGAIKTFLPKVTTSDITRTPYVDCACSAYDIGADHRSTTPGARESTDQLSLWQNILALDVLHHLCRPFDFFASAAAALHHGGRIILMEPAATPFGLAFYRLFHGEPITPLAIQPPFVFDPASDTGTFANMAMAQSLFVTHRETVDSRLHQLGLRVSHLSYRDVIAYPLTGGYSSRQLVPTFAIRLLIRIESLLPQFVLRRFGLRVLIVLEALEQAS